MEVIVNGHGFMSDDLSITFDGNQAEIVENSISNTQVCNHNETLALTY